MLSGGSYLSSVRRFKTATTSIATAPIRHRAPGVTEATNALTAGICITVK